jgi:hypothetical protein
VRGRAAPLGKLARGASSHIFTSIEKGKAAATEFFLNDENISISKNKKGLMSMSGINGYKRDATFSQFT